MALPDDKDGRSEGLLVGVARAGATITATEREGLVLAAPAPGVPEGPIRARTQARCSLRPADGR
jgi:hypothetical protein